MAENDKAATSPGRRPDRIGKVLLLTPFALFAFTAAMVHQPAPPPKRADPAARERLTQRGIRPDLESAVEAARGNDVLVLRLLARAGVDLDGLAAGGRTPLIEATLAGADRATRWLLKSGHAKLDTPGAGGLTPLEHAISAGKAKQVETLLDAGAVPRATDPGEPALLQIAARAGDSTSLTLLVDRGLLAGAPEALADAVGSGNVSVAKYLLENVADLPVPPAHRAVRDADIEMARLLLAHGADTSARDAEGNTALGLALLEERRPMAELLLKSGADADAPMIGGATPLEHAFATRDRELASLLLDHGAAPHPVLFRRAAEREDLGWMRLLAAHGAPLNPVLEDGDTLLSRAVGSAERGLAGELLSLGADPDRPGKEGQAPLVIAVAKRSTPMIRTLLDAGANPNRLLHHPVKESFHELADSKTLSFYLKRDSRFTPLMVAAAIGEPDPIRALLASGASRSRYTRSWKRYPISFAAEAKHILAQQLLVGYDPAEQDDRYKIVISLSKQTATLFKNGDVIDSSKVSTGKKGYRTPTGEYVVTHKHRHHRSTLYDAAPMPYFMRFSCGAFGTHTGHCPGYPASHGCIRMPDAKAKAFFYTAPTGTPVSIVD